MEKMVLDVSGLLCPLPVLKAKKLLRGIGPGNLLEIITTDPGAVADFKCLCEEDSLELIHQKENKNTCIHLIKKL